jgi:hypothetical protein
MNGAHGWPFDRPGGNGGTRMILNPLTLWLDPVAGRVIEGAVAVLEDFGAQMVDPGRLAIKAPDVRLTSSEAGRDRPAETRHPVDHRTAHPRLGFLPSQTPGA